ncbi:MAG: dephospho-CoA kinase [Limosilactobacillus sp.]|uniref:dephospho-CoA kinase n=1 Tax=Limosilactobacillus sp. TaxID=2773925 RepID=UPI0026FECEDE|nr:dephospho-CoA kinase [Limosilactobacillus sp.]
MTKVVGLTGGIASGKSTVSAMLQSVGFAVIDADMLAHRLQQPGQPGFERLVDQFGSQILTASGQIDRVRLGHMAFSNPATRDKLNQLMQPIIRETIHDQIASLKKAGAPVIILDVPLLFEQHYDDDCDMVVVVSLDQDTQLKRLEERNGYTRSEALSRINAQMPLAQKVEKADLVIDNNRDLKYLQSQVAQLVDQLKTE